MFPVKSSAQSMLRGVNELSNRLKFEMTCELAAKLIRIYRLFLQQRSACEKSHTSTMPPTKKNLGHPMRRGPGHSEAGMVNRQRATGALSGLTSPLRPRAPAGRPSGVQGATLSEARHHRLTGRGPRSFNRVARGIRTNVRRFPFGWHRRQNSTRLLNHAGPFWDCVTLFECFYIL